MAACPICAAVLPAPAIEAPDRLHATCGTFAVAQCPSCGAGRTLPEASPAQLAAFYPSEYGPYVPERHPVLRLVSAAIRGWQAVLARRSLPISAIAGRPPGRGLDVGAGRGDLSAMLVGAGWQMTAVEPSAEACEAARARGVDAREGVLATVELEPGSYDAAVFQHSLEHVEDPVGDLLRTFAALRPGGVLAVTVPNFGGAQARRFGGCWYHLDVPRHRVHFTPQALRRALTEAGFTVESVTTSTSAVGLPASVQYRVVGRCLFPGGLGLRVAAGLCALALPLNLLFDRLLGGGDLLHAVARRP